MVVFLNNFLHIILITNLQFGFLWIVSCNLLLGLNMLVLILFNGMSVSYTHLDVYKRQELPYTEVSGNMSIQA